MQTQFMQVTKLLFIYYLIVFFLNHHDGSSNLDAGF